MARKKITANLNGGDAVTAMADLEFQVYDAIDDTEITAANYAAIGSVNNNGTDGVNINYTLDVNYDPGSGLLGQIILDGVDIEDVTSIKIRCRDESGNESVLSAEAEALILFEDDFTGTSLDTSKWTLTNPDGTWVPVQNDNISVTSTGATDNKDNYYESVNKFAVKVFSFDIKKTNQNAVNSLWTMAVREDLELNQSSMNFAKVSTAGKVQWLIRIGGSNVLNEEITFDISTIQTMKIVDDGINIKLYYWNSSVWTQIGTTYVGTMPEDLYVYMLTWGVGADSDPIVWDNVVITNDDFTTQRPS